MKYISLGRFDLGRHGTITKGEVFPTGWDNKVILRWLAERDGRSDWSDVARLALGDDVHHHAPSTPKSERHTLAPRP